jgi:hypothetical protein
MTRHASLARLGTLAIMSLGLVVGLVGIGWLIAAGQAKLLLVAVAGGGICALAMNQRGAFVGISTLAAMDGLPFFDTSRHVASKITIQDVAVALLLLVAVVWIASTDGHRPGRAARVLSFAGVLLSVWWTWTLARTWSGQDVSLMHASSFGRDFGFFALLLMVLPQVRLTNRDIGMLLGVLTAGVCVFAMGQIAIALGAGRPGSLIHIQRTLTESGVTRVYASMTDLVTAGLAVSVAASLLARETKIRLVAFPVALLLTASTILQLTRARWIGLVVGLVLVSLWRAFNDDARLAAVLRRRLTATVGALVLLVAIVVLVAPGIVSGGTIVHRITSVFTELQSGGGTVAIRERVTKTMTAYLGEKWPAGFGFVPPANHYFEGLPEGSIRNSDVGVLNAVMTMGAIGAAFIYLPVVLMLLACLRRVPRRLLGPYGWLRYGGAIWIVAALVSSATLVTFFSASGLAMSAVLLTVLAHPSVAGDTRTVESSSRMRFAAGPAIEHPLTT